MKKGRIVRSSLVPDQFYFISRWKKAGKGIEVIDPERSRWDISAGCLALEKNSIKLTLQALIARAEADDKPEIVEWLKTQHIVTERWTVSHDTPTHEIEPPENP